MNILFLVSSLHGGGAERVAAILSNAWADRGHAVTLMPTFSGRGTCFYPLNSTVVVDYLADHVNGNQGKLRRLLTLRRYISKVRPDVIVSFLPHVNVATLVATIGMRIPVIACERTHPALLHPPLPRGYQLARKWLYPRATLVGVQTQAVGDWVLENIPGSLITTIANPIALPLSRTQPVILPDATLPKERKVVLAVGRLHPTKRFDYLIKSFCQCAESMPGWDLVLLGSGESRSDLLDIISASNFPERIYLPGQSGNLSDWYSRADIFAMTSANEGFPNTLLEAMAHDLPTISFDILTGPRELTDNGRRGILLPDQDHVPAMGAALTQLMQNADQRAALAKSAGEVRDIYSLDAVLAQWDACLARAVSLGSKTG